MSILVQAQPANAPRSRTAVQIAVLYAGILTIMSVAQLFTFEEFIEQFFSLDLALPQFVEALFIPLLIVFQVTALPFLLRMNISPAFRWLSMAAGWIVPLGWLFIALSTANAYPLHETVGLLGAAVSLAPGWWAVAVSALFALMAAWASWGLWPSKILKTSEIKEA